MNDDRIDKSGTPAIDTSSAVNRRILMAGAAGAGLATAGYLRLARAQTDSATPEATVTDEAVATPDVSPTGDQTSRAAAVLERAEAARDAVAADRDAVADQFDAATVDDVLSRASLLLDDAQTALDGDDAEGAARLAAGVWHATEAARNLIVAQLTFAGLPSQEASASRILARAYERIDAAVATSSTADENASFYVTTAQTVYGTAYDQYTEGAYAPAIANGKAIAGLVGTAAILSGSTEHGLGGMFGDGGPGRDGRDRIIQLPTDVQPMPDGDEPEAVPAPDF